MEEKWKQKASESVCPTLLNGILLFFQSVFSCIRYRVTVEAEME